ncbi:DMT family transporter [Alphaproteobacteria bacterium KMM 3653]|uniref:DMT family transporter n=2 Tax=Harenicola maris TaxID=2841044 RepID=A0AAP2CS03_9RHOB|nr:DMT family transporter [Harenicola maris]
MALSMAAFTINDAAIKVIMTQVPFYQTIFLRGVFTTLGIVLLAYLLGQRSLGLARQDRMRIFLRAGADVGATLFFLTALRQMPLANVTAILQTAPLTITLAGAVFLGDPVGWRRWLAILVGFAGVMMIVQPGTEGFSFFSLYALIAVCFVTLRDYVTRGLSEDTSSMTVAGINALAVTLCAGIGSMGEVWQPVTGANLRYLAISITAIIGAYYFSVATMRVGELSFVSPFRYTSLVWALVLGYFTFGDFPGPLTLFGAFTVVAMGIYTIYREGQLARAPASD